MLRPCSRAGFASSIPNTKQRTAEASLEIFRFSPVFGSVAESIRATKCRLCSSGLYISMVRFLSRSACSSLVKLSALLELSVMKAAAMISKSLRDRLFMERVRGGTEFLSDYLTPSAMPDNKHKYNGIWPDFGRSPRPIPATFWRMGLALAVLIPLALPSPARAEPDRLSGGDMKHFAPDAVELGWNYFKQGDCETALKRFQMAIRHDPDFAPAYFGAAYVCS